MDKITLANALKAVFGTSITPTSSQYVPITASDGTPAGISSMSALASVLGVMVPKGHVSSLDANTVLEPSVYSVNDTSFATHNLPSQWGVLLTFSTGAGSSYRTLQVWVQSTLSRIYFRINNNNTWTDWKYADLV